MCGIPYLGPLILTPGECILFLGPKADDIQNMEPAMLMKRTTCDQIQISAKNLGHLALPSFCPRCFWLKMRVRGKFPYQVFPGIFSSIDSYSKKITWRHYEKHGVIPEWLQVTKRLAKPMKVERQHSFPRVSHDHKLPKLILTDELSYLVYLDGAFLNHHTNPSHKMVEHIFYLYRETNPNRVRATPTTKELHNQTSVRCSRTPG